jgi:single-strand DNA-binding protein
MNTNIKNSVTLVGNVGREVQVMTFDNGNKKVTFSLATIEFYKDAKGEKVTQTQWHNLVAWGKTAELISQNVEKGHEISISGKLANRSYVAKDGSTKYVTEVVVGDFFKVAKRTAQVAEVTPF